MDTLNIKSQLGVNFNNQNANKISEKQKVSPSSMSYLKIKTISFYNP